MRSRCQDKVTPKTFGVLRCSSYLSSSASSRLLLVLLAPAFTDLKSGTEYTNAVYTNHKVSSKPPHLCKGQQHVHVGWLFEVDSSVDSSMNPATGRQMAEWRFRRLRLRMELGNAGLKQQIKESRLDGHISQRTKLSLVGKPVKV